MLIKTLVENTASSDAFTGTHGLSLYIETANHKILFDLGPDNNLFLENADKMDVDIAEVDTVIISHGHFDHGGALKTFLENNSKAKIYLRESAFDEYYLKILFLKFYIGLNSSLKASDRLIFTEDYLRIDEELQLFSGITEKKFYSEQNKTLMRKVGKKLFKDEFEHEQSLLIFENNTYTLFGGCAHKGIINILEKAETMTGSPIKTVISGFHFLRMPMNEENKKFLHGMAEELLKRKTVYYTCHCTGLEPYQVLKQMMGERIQYISTGCELELYITEPTMANRELSIEERTFAK